MSYGSLGAQFVISKVTDAPTIYYEKYIMFGKVTVTLRASPGAGTVSSFILESDDLDEIDWEWLGTSDVNVESNFFGKGNTTTYDRALYHPVADPIGTFSTYTIDWTAASTNWYINGALVRTLSYGDPLAVYGKNYPQTPMRVKMGSTATQGTCQWAMGPSTSYIDWNSNPSFTMYVQSVTIQDYGSGGNYVYTDESGNWQSIQSEGGSGNSNSGGSSSSSASKTSTGSSTSTGGTLKETSTSTTSSTSTQATTSATTLTTATGSSTGSKTTSSSATTTSKPAQSTSSGAETMKPKHKYGVIDVAVIGLGLGMGYLFM
jgi:beta-glucanase (GH16 family)